MTLAGCWVLTILIGACVPAAVIWRRSKQDTPSSLESPLLTVADCGDSKAVLISRSMAVFYTVFVYCWTWENPSQWTFFTNWSWFALTLNIILAWVATFVARGWADKPLAAQAQATPDADGPAQSHLALLVCTLSDLNLGNVFFVVFALWFLLEKHPPQSDDWLKTTVHVHGFNMIVVSVDRILSGIRFNPRRSWPYLLICIACYEFFSLAILYPRDMVRYFFLRPTAPYAELWIVALLAAALLFHFGLGVAFNACLDRMPPGRKHAAGSRGSVIHRGSASPTSSGGLAMIDGALSPGLLANSQSPTGYSSLDASSVVETSSN